MDWLISLIKTLFGKGSSPDAETVEQPAPKPDGGPAAATPPPEFVILRTISATEDAAPVDLPDQPPDDVDDPNYDIEHETDDDSTPREALPEPDADTVEEVERQMAPISIWAQRQKWLKDAGFDPGQIDGKPGRKTEAAVRSFQTSAGLISDGDWGPKTEKAIRDALKGLHEAAPPPYIPPLPTLGKPKYEEMIGGTELDDSFWASFVDLTAKSNVKDSEGRRRRKGMRLLKNLKRICLHQTAFTWRPYRETKANGKRSGHHQINAHICFDTDGSILLIHNFAYYLWTANSFNPSVHSWEIMGNFEGVLGSGKWYKPDKFGRSRPNRKQIIRVRQLILWMTHPELGPIDNLLPTPLREWRVGVRTIGQNPIKWVNAHRQSTNDREIDCGSECWYHIARWAAEKIPSLSTGPESGNGMKIPTEWMAPPIIPPIDG